MDIWKAGEECQHPTYPVFKETLNRASYHFADDSGKEWAHGYQLVREAVEIAIVNKYPFWAIKRILTDIQTLVDLNQFMEKYVQVASERYSNSSSSQ